MKLATSTGDFSHYFGSVADKVRALGGTKFKNINLELTGQTPALFGGDDDWRAWAEELALAKEEAGVSYVVAHAPCLHNPIVNEAGELLANDWYKSNILAIRRSIEMCHLLGIPRIVIHACASASLSEDAFIRYNKRFYSEFFDLMEKYDITVMTENWDNNATHFSTGKEMRAFIDEINHPLFAACWDTAHGNICPKARAIGQYENLVALGDKLKGLHISDNFGDTHHHSWPFAGVINFDSVMQALTDVRYDGYFTFEASYTLLHQNNLPYNRKAWEHKGEVVTRLLNPSVALKQKAVDLLFETGKYILESYGCFEKN